MNIIFRRRQAAFVNSESQNNQSGTETYDWSPSSNLFAQGKIISNYNGRITTNSECNVYKIPVANAGLYSMSYVSKGARGSTYIIYGNIESDTHNIVSYQKVTIAGTVSMSIEQVTDNNYIYVALNINEPCLITCTVNGVTTTIYSGSLQ